MKKAHCSLVAVAFLCASSLSAQQPVAAPASGNPPSGMKLTLADAEATAIKNNPQITVARLQALVAQQQVREVRSALLPNADINLTGVESNPGSRVTAGALNNPTVFPRAAYGAALSQLITDFGRTGNLVSSSKLEAKAKDQDAVATRAQILLAVDQAFYDTLEAQAMVHVAEETVRARQILVDKVSALTQAKLKSDLDLSFANVDLSRSKLLLLESKSKRETAMAQLSAILGYPDMQNFDLIEQAEPLSPPAPDVVPMIQQALAQRPEVLALQYQEQSAEKFSRAEHDLWLPTISALGVVGEAPVRDDNIPNWYGAAGVNIRIPIFNGFQYNARAKAADLSTEASRQRLADLRNNVARDVRIIWQASNRAYERLAVTKQLRDQANLALELAQSRYNLGLSSIVEFSQAELQKTEADIADTDATYQYRQTERAIRFVTGVLQ